MKKQYYHISISSKKYIISLIILFMLISFFMLYLKIIPRFKLLFPDCMFKSVLHIYCPGCGGTRAILSFFKLRIIDAFFYNPFVSCIVICISFFYIKIGILLIKNKGTAEYDINLIWLWSTLIFLLIFFVVRNLLLIFAGVDYLGELRAYWN